MIVIYFMSESILSAVDIIMKKTNSPLWLPLTMDACVWEKHDYIDKYLIFKILYNDVTKNKTI